MDVIDLTEEDDDVQERPKRARMSPCADTPDHGAKRFRFDDCEVVEHTAGPSRALVAPEPVDGDDCAVIESQSKLASCQRKLRFASIHRGYTSFQQRMLRTGTRSTDHCNITKKSATARRPARQALLGQSFAAAAARGGPSAGPMYSDDEDDDEDDDSGDDDGYCEFSEARRRRRGYTSYWDHPMDYDDDEEDDSMDGGMYGGVNFCGMPNYFPLGPPPMPARVNTWVYHNDDAALYKMTPQTMGGVSPDAQPGAVALTPVTVTQKNLGDLVLVGRLDLHVRLKNGLQLQQAQAELRKAAWGFKGPQILQDWRPPSLKQEIEWLSGSGKKAPRVPQLPKQTIELLPLPLLPTDPRPPPSEKVLRVIQFIDCFGSEPLQLVGMDCLPSTTARDIKSHVLATCAPGDHSTRATLILAARADKRFRVLRDDDTFADDDDAGTTADFGLANESGYGSRTGEPLVCWRVQHIAKEWKNAPKASAARPGYGYSYNIHYMLVQSYIAVDQLTEELYHGMGSYRIAGQLPVPVLIPVQKSSGSVGFSPYGGSTASKAIASAVKDIFAKWVSPDARGVLTGANIHKSLFTATRNTSPAAQLAGKHVRSWSLHGLTDTQFAVSKNPQALEVFGLWAAPNAASIAMLHLLWDLPKVTGSAIPQNVVAGTEMLQTSARLFDVQALFNPRRSANLTDKALKQSQSWLQQRSLMKEFNAKRSKTPFAVIQELLPLCQTPGAPVQGHATRVSVKCTLHPVSNQNGEPGLAALRLTVYTPKSGPFSVLSSFTDWPASGASTADDRRMLHTFLSALLRGNAAFNRMQKQLADFAVSAGMSLNNVLDRLEAADDLLEAPQPQGLVPGIKLHKYQKQSLQWMLEREARPLREALWVPLEGADTPLYYSPVLSRLTLDVPSGPRGGILAEEMGLGKTVEILALVLANPAPPNIAAGAILNTEGGPFVQSRGTLVICKVSLVGQWVTEARSKLADRNVQICEYHGTNRLRDVSRLAAYDIVVTTYETLSSDSLGRSRKSVGEQNPLGKISWWRLVLDESHTIKDTSTKAFKAVNELKVQRPLQAARRWACSGTPINTDTKDLVGQLAALHMEPLGTKYFFNRCLRNALGSSRSMFLYVMDRLLIRHSKKRVMGASLQLPPKTEDLVPVVFDPQEWTVYSDTHKRVKRAFQQYEAMGPYSCNKHQLAIMALLTPLRRLCSGGSFSRSQLEVRDEFIAAAAASSDNTVCFPSADDSECPICMEDFDNPMRTPCGHWFCAECISQVLGRRPNCPLCRTPVQANALRRAVYPTADPAAEAGPSTVPAVMAMDAKITALMEQLRVMREADPNNKALIFTQYNDTLTYLTRKLAAKGFTYRTITGSMAMKKRAEAIAAFQNDPPTTVFILSLRSGAVGINLTSANYVFMLEPVLNPALDEQAVGRAWRMGQKRSVTVKRLFVKGTIEENIMDVVKSRGDHMADTDHGRAHVAHVAGAVRSDKARLKFDELKKLFADPQRPS